MFNDVVVLNKSNTIVPNPQCCSDPHTLCRACDDMVRNLKPEELDYLPLPSAIDWAKESDCFGEEDNDMLPLPRMH